MDLDKVDLMTEIDSLRRGWQACASRLAAVEAERDAARAGEARAVEALERLEAMESASSAMLPKSASVSEVDND